MNKYILDKRKAIIKLNTDTLDKVCSDCDLKCECTSNY